MNHDHQHLRSLLSASSTASTSTGVSLNDISLRKDGTGRQQQFATTVCDIAAMLKHLCDREEQVSRRESRVAAREEKLGTRESVCSEMEAQAVQKLAEAAELEGENRLKSESASKQLAQLRDREAVLVRKDAAVAHREDAIAVQEARLRQRETTANDRDASIHERETELDAWDTELDKRRICVDARLAEVGKREALVSRREAELGWTRSQLDERESALRKRAAELDDKEAQLDHQVETLADRQARIGEQEETYVKMSERATQRLVLAQAREAGMREAAMVAFQGMQKSQQAYLRGEPSHGGRPPRRSISCGKLKQSCLTPMKPPVFPSLRSFSCEEQQHAQEPPALPTLRSQCRDEQQHAQNQTGTAPLPRSRDEQHHVITILQAKDVFQTAWIRGSAVVKAIQNETGFRLITRVTKAPHTAQLRFPITAAAGTLVMMEMSQVRVLHGCFRFGLCNEAGHWVRYEDVREDGGPYRDICLEEIVPNKSIAEAPQPEIRLLIKKFTSDASEADFSHMRITLKPGFTQHTKYK